MSSDLRKPLSDDDYEALAEALEKSSPFDVDGLLGLLHAVAIAPSLIPPSKWLHALLPDGMPGLDAEAAQGFFGLVMRLHNEILDALSEPNVIMPEPDDHDGCDAFAEGFLAGASSDDEWVGNDDHWTFASWAAFLANERDLVSPSLLAKFDEDPDTRKTLYRHMGVLVLAARDSFLKARGRGAAPMPNAASSPAARVGRNDPCPCGSGKKFKRCCIDQGRPPTN